MSDTGAMAAGTVVNIADSGQGTWSGKNAANDSVGMAGAVATADGATWATTGTAFNNKKSQTLRLTNFGFAVPSDATIDGIELTIVRRQILSGSTVDDTIRLCTNSAGTAADQFGSNLASATTWPASTFAAATYGGPTNKWGAALTPAIVNASAFGLDIKVAYGSSQQIPQIDQVLLKVYYTVSGGGGGTTYNESLSESVTAGATFASAQTFNNSLAEAVTAGDSIGGAQTMPNSLGETVTAGATFASAQTMPNALSETVTAAASVTSAMTFNASLGESVTAGDSISSAMTFSASLSESVAAMDQVTSQQTFVEAIEEMVSAIESLTSTAIYNVTLSEIASADFGLVGLPEHVRVRAHQ